MLRQKKMWLGLAMILCTIVASAIVVRGLGFFSESPFVWTRAWESPSAVACAPDGSVTVVVENSKMRVSLLDAQGQLLASIRGGSYDADSFYYAEHVATDGQCVVIAEVRHAENSTFVAGERLLAYDLQGRQTQVLYEANYEGEQRPQQLGRIRSVRVENGVTTFAWVDGSRAGATRCENGTQRELLSVSLQEDAFSRVAYEAQTGTLAFTTRKGALGTVHAGEEPVFFSYGDGERIPWGVDALPNGTLIVSDLMNESIDAVTPDGSQTLWQGGLVYELCVAGERLAFTDGESVEMLDLQGHPLSLGDRVELSAGYATQLSLVWLSAVWLALVFGYLVWQLIRVMRGKRSSEVRRRMLIAFLGVAVAVAALLAFLLPMMQQQMNHETSSQLSQLAEALGATSGTMIGNRLENIRELSDYQNEDYNALRAYMNAFCDASYHSGSNLYYILYYFDQDRLWGVMDYENTTGTRYPYVKIADTVYGEVIATGETRLVEGEANMYGMWSYAVAPVYASDGHMAGLVEIGTNQYGQVVARRSMLGSVLIGVLVALMMTMLLLNEGTAFHDERVRRPEQPHGVALGMIRPLIFLVFLADNMDAAYIPQLSATLYAGTAGFPGAELASALPMSAQLLAIGVAALLWGRVLDGSRPRTVLRVGFLLQITGALLAIAAVNLSGYWLLVGAKVIGGLGTGAAVVTCNATPARATQEQERQRLFAGMNVGILTGVVLGSSIGGYIADWLGYTAVYAASVLCVLAAILPLKCGLWALERSEPETPEESVAGKEHGILRFLSRPGVLGLMLMIMLPYMLMMYFKDYLFPLYASGLGKSEGAIGSAMLLGGALAILLGDTVPHALFARIGVWNTLRLSSLTCAYALGLFALDPSFDAAVITLCLLGISASFGYAAQGTYHAALIRESQVAEGQAVGAFSLFDNLGQTGGPLVLGALYSLGAGAAAGWIAVGGTLALLGATVMHAWEGRRHRSGS